MPTIKAEILIRQETPKHALHTVRMRIKQIQKSPDYKNYGPGYLATVRELNQLRLQLEFDHKTGLRCQPLESRREVIVSGIRFRLSPRRFNLPIPGECQDFKRDTNTSHDVWVRSTLLPKFRQSRKPK